MANVKYSIQSVEENMVKAYGRSLPLSTKVSVEIANFLRGRTVSDAKLRLNRVINHDEAVPFKRFNNGVGHRKGNGMAAGRFPQKASKAFLELIRQLEANAQNSGLDENLKLQHIAVHKAPGQQKSGRRMSKRSHIELVAVEIEEEKPSTSSKSSKAKKSDSKNTASQKSTKNKDDSSTEKKEAKSNNDASAKKESEKSEESKK